MSLRTANSGTCERDSSPSPRLGSSVPASCSLAASVWLLARACLPCLCLIRLSHFDERENTCTFAIAHCRAGGVLLIGLFTYPGCQGNSPQQLSCQSRRSRSTICQQSSHALYCLHLYSTARAKPSRRCGCGGKRASFEHSVQGVHGYRKYNSNTSNTNRT